ncbi:MAG: SDR family NAD(P)-dependent oxidoreductase [Phycisphaerae bacterium]
MPVAVITGASRGIGRAIAMRFARDGYDLAIAARHEDDLEAVAEAIGEEAGVQIFAVAADVGTREGADEILSAAVERFGRVDVLINNAGTAPLSPIATMDDDAFHASLDVNVASVFYMTRAAWSKMKKQGGGTIVNISSLASLDPFPGFAVYGACKAWVNLFTKAAATEGKADNIRVFGVGPGAVETQMLRGHFPDFPAAQALEPGAIANAVFAVCDDAFAHSSGQTIFVAK